MSMNQILEEFPRLTPAERREIARRVIESEPEADDLAACDAAARAGFALLEQMEAEDEALACSSQG
jgi:hypothetical protein